MRFAAIDIGSNSVRSLVVDVPDGGRHRVIDDERAQTRLGAGLATEGRMKPAAMEQTEDALRRMLDIARSLDAEHLRIVATAAVRDAENGPAFVAGLEERLGTSVEVISAEDEGRLAFLSAAAHFELSGPVAVFDLGGGSLEIVRADGHDIAHIDSQPLGAVRLTESFVTADPLPAKQFERLRTHVRAALRETLGSSPEPVSTLIGSGGTLTTLGSLTTGGAVSGTRMQGMYVPRERIDSVYKTLRESSAKERKAMPGMPPHRVDIIVAGVLVVREVVRALGAEAVLVNTKGVREGLILDTIGRLTSAPARRDRMEFVDELAARYSSDRQHAERVRDSALSLFDQLGDGLGLPAEQRTLLEAAALLHDVGYYIDYHAHHKHSWHLITHADLPGFSARELQLIAAIARYHRGALPKRGHEALLPLEPAEQDAAIQLGALLRLADGIDRTRSQRVTELRATLADGTAQVTLVGDTDLTSEVYGARQKGDLFTEAFGLPLAITAADSYDEIRPSR